MESPAMYLQKNDPILGAVIKKVTLAPLQPSGNHFASLVESIISQQLSVKVADVIFARFTALFSLGGFPSPAQVLKIPLDQLRTIGLSAQKANYIKNLARAAATKTIDFSSVRALSDEDVITHLIQVKGIGPWTAEMFLIFSLNRPDVFSYGDLGLRNAMKKLYNLKKDPSPRRAEQIAKPWKPYRSLASRYLWASQVVKL